MMRAAPADDLESLERLISALSGQVQKVVYENRCLRSALYDAEGAESLGRALRAAQCEHSARAAESEKSAGSRVRPCMSTHAVPRLRGAHVSGGPYMSTPAVPRPPTAPAIKDALPPTPPPDEPDEQGFAVTRHLSTKSTRDSCLAMGLQDSPVGQAMRRQQSRYTNSTRATVTSGSTRRSCSRSGSSRRGTVGSVWSRDKFFLARLRSGFSHNIDSFSLGMAHRMRRCLRMKCWWLDWIVGSIIMANTVCIGIDVQARVDGEASPLPPVLDHLFLAFFTVELCLRSMANDNGYVKSGWFMLDLSCVVVGVLLKWIIGPILVEAGDSIALAAVSHLLEIFRLLRLVRALRLITMVPELMALCMGLISSMRTVASACLLLIIALYILACLGFQAIASSEVLNSDPVTRGIVRERFSTLLRTILTLMSFTNGDSLAGMYEPLIERQPSLAVFFGAVWVVVTVALMNLVTAVIVNTAIEQHKENDRLQRAMMRKKVKRLTPVLEHVFEVLDTSQEGSLDIQELDFSKLVGVNLLPSDLRKFVSANKLKDLFQFLDIDGSGTVEKDEFVDGVIHLILQQKNVPVETTQMLQLLHIQNQDVVALKEKIGLLQELLQQQVLEKDAYPYNEEMFQVPAVPVN